VSKRLILKSGDYQLSTEWEKKGDRVRFFSSERKEWEEIPDSLVDWAATEKWNAQPTGKAPVSDGAKRDEEDDDVYAREPEELTVEGVVMPDTGGIYTIEHDVLMKTPLLIELNQNGGAINQLRTKNMMRAIIVPIPGSQRASVELQGVHSAVQLKSSQPVFYIQFMGVTEEKNDDSFSIKAGKKLSKQEILLGKFRLVRLTAKNNIRIVAALKISMTGNMSQQEKFIESHSDVMQGGWIKFWPEKPLEPGEYAIVEMLSPTEMNLFVWDFGVGK